MYLRGNSDPIQESYAIAKTYNINEKKRIYFYFSHPKRDYRWRLCDIFCFFHLTSSPLHTQGHIFNFCCLLRERECHWRQWLIDEKQVFQELGDVSFFFRIEEQQERGNKKEI